MEPTATATVTAEQLAEADASFKKALELRDSDLETAVVLLGKVLETRNKAYGENAPECADTYLYYGQCLFEQAQAASDVFGDQMKSAANERAKAIAAAEEAAEGGAPGSSGAGDEDEADADADADDMEADKAREEQAAAADNTNAPAAAAAAAAPADAPVTTTTTTAPSTTDAAAAGGEGGAAGTDGAGEQQQEGEEGEEEESEEEEGSSDSSGEDVGEGEAGKADDGDAAAAAGAPEVTGEGDDMALAWEMLELARLIYINSGGPDTHANKLADCHLYIGDILAEQEKFEAAVEEYKTALEMLGRLEGGHDAHRRRAAELDFKQATALQLLDAPAEALAAMQLAKAHLAAHLETIDAEVARAGSSGADVSGAVASAAFASILSGYAAPAAAAPDAAASEDSKARVAKLHQEAADLRGTIDSINDRIEELSAAVQEHISMKEQLANIFKAVAAEGGGDDGSSEPAAAGSSGGAGAGVTETIGFGAPAGSSKAAAGEVKDIGVIGKGRRVAPTPMQVETPAAPAAAASALAAAEAGAEGSKQAAPDQAAAPAGGEVGKKRALSDLSSSDQEAAAEGTRGASTDDAAAKLAAAAAGAQQPDAAPKRARV